MKIKEIEAYLEMLTPISKMSHARRLKVAAIIAKPKGIIVSYGYNGTPSGTDNNCEYEDSETKELVTKENVIHGEMNAILKAAREGRSCEGAWLFVTHAPCNKCAIHVAEVGIKHVVYLNEYRSDTGVTLLNQLGVPCEKWEPLNTLWKRKKYANIPVQV